jgi:hypothetical protein
VQEFIDLLGIEKRIRFSGFRKTPQEKYPYYTVSKVGGDDGNVFYDYAIRMFASGTFFTRMKLEEFPLDTQTLTISVTCDMPNIVNFIEHYGSPSLFLHEDFRLESTFDIPYEKLVFTKLSFSDKDQSNTKYQYPKICFSFEVTRKSKFYLYFIVLPVAFISGLSLLSMSMNDDGHPLQTSERLSVTLVLLLTFVAYKLVVAESLPKLCYQTYLDSYLWWAFGFIFAVALENIFFPMAMSNSTAHGSWKAEKFIASIYAGVFIIVHAFLGLEIWIRLDARKKKEVQKFQLETVIRNAGKADARGASTEGSSSPTRPPVVTSQVPITHSHQATSTTHTRIGIVPTDEGSDRLSVLTLTGEH